MAGRRLRRSARPLFRTAGRAVGHGRYLRRTRLLAVRGRPPAVRTDALGLALGGVGALLVPLDAPRARPLPHRPRGRRPAGSAAAWWTVPRSAAVRSRERRGGIPGRSLGC